MRKISLEELKKIISKIPKKNIEKPCNDMECALVHYEEFIDPEQLIYVVETFLKRKRNVRAKS